MLRMSEFFVICVRVSTNMCVCVRTVCICAVFIYSRKSVFFFFSTAWYGWLCFFALVFFYSISVFTSISLTKIFALWVFICAINVFSLNYYVSNRVDVTRYHLHPFAATTMVKYSANMAKWNNQHNNKQSGSNQKPIAKRKAKTRVRRKMQTFTKKV